MFSALLESYETTSGKGLPIGNLTSQYFANLYLDPFDRHATATGRFAYLRYMDDMLLFGDHDELITFWRETPDFLDANLRLTLKHGGSLHRLSQGVEFLGYRIFPHYMLLNHRSKVRFIRKTRRLFGEYDDGLLSNVELRQRIAMLSSFIDHADTHNFKQSTLGDYYMGA